MSLQDFFKKKHNVLFVEFLLQIKLFNENVFEFY